MAATRSIRQLVLLMCAAEILTMLGFGSFAALLPTLRDEWQLSNAAAGWIEGAFQAGYLSAVPLLVSLTDRVEARRIYVLSAIVGGLAALGFGLFANGLWSACLFRALGGIGLAGSFMPGLRILSDRCDGAVQSRAVAFYTACFSIGASVSVFVTGIVAHQLGWRWAFMLPAAGALAAAGIVLWVPAQPAARAAGRPALLDWRPALRNRRAIAYNLAYGAHMWELYGFRAWLVAFLAFALSAQGGTAPATGVTTIAALIMALALPASVLGNEAALRFGRQRVLTAVMLASAATAALVGWSAALSFPVTIAAAALYSTAVSADSASLTAGAVGAAPHHRGATMALHTLIGFAAATLGPLAFGAVLDLAGADRVLGWFLAFALLGAGVALGPLLLRLPRPAER